MGIMKQPEQHILEKKISKNQGTFSYLKLGLNPNHRSGNPNPRICNSEVKESNNETKTRYVKGI